MPLVTAPPVFVDIQMADFSTIANYGQDQNNLAGFGNVGTAGEPAYFIIGGKLYAFLSSITSTPGTGRALVSTDEGLTWTGLDEVNEPGQAGGNNITKDMKTYYSGVGSIVYVQYLINPGGGTVAFLNSFDTTGAGHWVGQSVASSVNFIPNIATYLVRLTSGDIYIISGSFPTGPGTNVQYTKFSGGAWTNTLVNVTPNTAGRSASVKGAWADSTDTIHVIYALTDGSTFENLFYVQISSTGVVGSPILLLTGSSTERYNAFLLNGLWLGQLAIAYQRKSDNITTVLVGSPLSLPVFTSIVVDPGASTVTHAALWPTCVVTPSNQLAVFWFTNTVGNTDDRIWRNISTSPTAFGNPPLFWYSQASNPAVGPVFEPVITAAPESIGNPVAFSDGTFSLLWDAVTADEFPSFAIHDALPAPAAASKKFLDATGLNMQLIPSIGAVCKFARPTRPTLSPRVIQVGKTLTYPDWFVG